MFHICCSFITRISLFMVYALATHADQITHTYDTQNRLIQSDYGNGQVVEYIYDATGNQIGQKAGGTSGLCKEEVVLYNNINPNACNLGNTATFVLPQISKVTRLGVWYNTTLGGASLGFTIKGPTETFNGTFVPAGCDPSQSQWCLGEAQINKSLDAGSYTITTASDAVCRNTASQNNGFSKVYGCTDINYLGPVLTVIKPTLGTVTSAPEGINCGGANNACFASFPTAFTLTATPIPGYGVKKWVGCLGITSGTTCSMTLTKDSTVKITFAKLPKYALKIIKTPYGSITSFPTSLICNEKAKACSAKFISGTKVQLFATPAIGRTFAGWGGVCSGRESCEVFMDKAKRVTAKFEAAQPLMK